MTRRDDAIKAAGLALHCDACTNDGHDGCDTSDWDREAETALDAALAVLHPTVPNTTEALDQLPVGTVIRADGQAYVHTDAWEWVETVTGTASTADELAAHHPCWRVIHTPQEPA